MYAGVMVVSNNHKGALQTAKVAGQIVFCKGSSHEIGTRVPSALGRLARVENFELQENLLEAPEVKVL